MPSKNRKMNARTKRMVSKAGATAARPSQLTPLSVEKVDRLLRVICFNADIPVPLQMKIRTFAHEEFVWDDGNDFACSLCNLTLPVAHTPVHIHLKTSPHQSRLKHIQTLRLQELKEEEAESLRKGEKSGGVENKDEDQINPTMTEIRPPARLWRPLGSSSHAAAASDRRKTTKLSLKTRVEPPPPRLVRGAQPDPSLAPLHALGETDRGSLPEELWRSLSPSLPTTEAVGGRRGDSADVSKVLAASFGEPVEARREREGGEELLDEQMRGRPIEEPQKRRHRERGWAPKPVPSWPPSEEVT